MAEGAPEFDPYAVMQALDGQGVSYIVVGGFARILQGTEELTRGIDIVPSTRSENLDRLTAALNDLGARRADRRELDLRTSVEREEPVIELTTRHGQVRVVPQPAGTRGFDDLRKAATRQPLGRGTSPFVASVGDLARMSSALEGEEHLSEVRQLRRLAELERSRTRSIER